MILKASKRGGAQQMARHLMNGEKNEHVTVHEVSGFASSKVDQALNEIYAISRGTKCSRFMFSLSLSPPQDQDVPVEVFEKALKQIEEKLKLTGQPRVIAFHEKHGRRHAHCVWNRIDAQKMTAIDLPFFKNRLKEIAKALYLEHHWKMPKGFINSAYKNPLNYTRAEWQQAARTSQNPKAIKAVLQECWATSDSRKAFETALQERGYYLAKGDRRGFVVVDVYGEVYSLPRQLGLKARDVQKRLGDPKALPSVDKTKEKITKQLSDLFAKYRTELQKNFEQEMRPLLRIKKTMTNQHRKDRAAQKAYQDKRWNEEQTHRASRIRRGFKGLWDKLTLKYWKLRKQNEKEAWKSHVRDREERQDLIEIQLDQRQKLQKKFINIQKKQEQETQNLITDLTRMTTKSPDIDATPEALRNPEKAILIDLEAGSPQPDPEKRKPRSPDKRKSPGAEPET